MPIDFTCLRHGKLMSQHNCLYCCICFADLTPEECFVDQGGVKWNVCKTCAVLENEALYEIAISQQENGLKTSPFRKL